MNYNIAENVWGSWPIYNHKDGYKVLSFNRIFPSSSSISVVPTKKESIKMDRFFNIDEHMKIHESFGYSYHKISKSQIDDAIYLLGYADHLMYSKGLAEDFFIYSTIDIRPIIRKNGEVAVKIEGISGHNYNVNKLNKYAKNYVSKNKLNGVIINFFKKASDENLYINIFVTLEALNHINKSLYVKNEPMVFNRFCSIGCDNLYAVNKKPFEFVKGPMEYFLRLNSARENIVIFSDDEASFVSNDTVVADFIKDVRIRFSGKSVYKITITKGTYKRKDFYKIIKSISDIEKVIINNISNSLLFEEVANCKAEILPSVKYDGDMSYISIDIPIIWNSINTSSMNMYKVIKDELSDIVSEINGVDIYDVIKKRNSVYVKFVVS